MNALTIKNLTKVYKNDLKALDDVSLEIKEGDFFALLGPNGAGKSTLINIITALVYKTAGQIKIFDTDIDDDFPKARAYLGVVPQEFNFGQGEKVCDILINQGGYYGVPRKTAIERSEVLLKQLGLWEKRNNGIRQLSGGMKRRLMIARALIHEPKLLILDEPTAGVDIEQRHIMWEFVENLNQHGMTIILTTHYLEEAENLCKNIAIINHGHVVENTNMRSLLRTVKKQTIVLDVEDPLPGTLMLDGHAYKQVDQFTLEIVLENMIGLSDVFKQLCDQNIKVSSMRNKSNRLEELFVQLTSVQEE